MTPPTRFPRPVVCAWCGNRYRAATPYDIVQGEGCSATVWLDQDGTWYLNAHYGSSDYDCMLFRFVEHPPAAPAYAVCDACISERYAAGELVRLEGWYP